MRLQKLVVKLYNIKEDGMGGENKELSKTLNIYGYIINKEVFINNNEFKEYFTNKITIKLFKKDISNITNPQLVEIEKDNKLYIIKSFKIKGRFYVFNVDIQD